MSAEHAEQGPNFELPKVAPERVPTEEKPQQGIEKGDPSLEGTPRAPATAMPQMPAPAIPTAQPPATADPTTPQAPTAAAHTSDLAAKDADLIEKEWVDKAKHIVAGNREDPYKQKNEISRVKADYVQKRFNKSLKLDDTTSSPS